MSYQYFYDHIARALKFYVPTGKNILFIGPYLQDHLKFVEFENCTILSRDESDVYTELLNGRNITVNYSMNLDDVPVGKFDYVIVYSDLGFCSDICSFFESIKSAFNPQTRLIIYQYNHLWMPFFKLGGYLKLKKSELPQNWLSVGDLSSYMKAMGYKFIKADRKTLFPLRLIFLGPLLNWLAVLFPFFDFLKISQFIFARLECDEYSEDASEPSLTICLTVRNEKENIPQIVEALPKIADDQEILFVEGHSTDGTREEIESMILKHPEKSIRVIGQPGIGQGDAIHTGFKDARGDIIILYEGDGTSDPGDIKYFYDAMASGRFEFIEGSRFVYPLTVEAMPPLNKIGNIVFAKWFSWFLKGHITDVLSGIKAVSKRDYENIYSEWGFIGVNDPFGDFNLLYGASQLGLQFGEIPMRYKPRDYGESKTKVFRHGWLLIKMAIYGYFVFRKE